MPLLSCSGIGHPTIKPIMTTESQKILVAGAGYTAVAQASADASTKAELKPQEVYDGGYGHSGGQPIAVRIANGGAGQSGLIGAWANAFIKYMVEKTSCAPFLVGWYLGDTTESLGFVKDALVDIAVTYNKAAEEQSMNDGYSVQRLYGFRDHFMLVGPKGNPANLQEATDNIFAMFNKIVTCGNADIIKNPTDRDPTRFLTRFDKSATNIKESQLFAQIGQVPWAYAYSKWYHQYVRFPLQALEAASVLREYTLTDYGTWLSSAPNVTGMLKIYKKGTDNCRDPLLNPAHVLLRAKIEEPERARLSEEFMKWVVDADGGQKVVETFTGKGKIVLYTRAPKKGEGCKTGCEDCS
ncbi:hypothetical protein BD779DRAFT_1560205 [Infundibulicybe gibba]|nr:hypothetical protein BD779DRAFT_1560205 [Infundibulicybe gibba]